MDKNKKMYFSTGEFARLCNVNKKTLFHYDNIDLFKPERVLSNGYRYYSHYQLELFNVIYTLKTIGMSLIDIKSFINKRDAQSVIELFEYQTKEVEKEIKILKRIQKIISNKVNIINDAMSYTSEIRLEEQKREYLILSEPIDITKRIYDIDNYVSHLNYINKNHLNYGYPVGAIITKDDLKKEIYDVYSYYFTNIDKKTSDSKIFVKPKGMYVVGYSKGYYDKTPFIYYRLMEYIRANDLSVIGNSYEQILLDEVVSKNMDDYIIKVCIHVEQ
ncbi:MerR family transcriptional regulator [Metaclostridioides mangenotii]|uniref:MerR family transcriptional regulator n=1 Tax=Metaclostridioides mangenotii TaxID=1540 RepID=UPI0004885D84|nr:MerR family transcriptional regulator [Clostridioides mangenotii]